MLWEAIKPPEFKTSKEIEELVKKYGIPSKEVLMALRRGRKCNKKRIMGQEE